KAASNIGNSTRKKRFIDQSPAVKWNRGLRSGPCADARGSQLARQAQLALQAFVAAAGAAGALERTQRQADEHVAEVLVRDGIGGIVAQGGLQQLAGGVDAALRSLQHREVVVRLGQVREVLDQLVQRVDRLAGAL